MCALVVLVVALAWDGWRILPYMCSAYMDVLVALLVA